MMIEVPTDHLAQECLSINPELVEAVEVIKWYKMRPAPTGGSDQVIDEDAPYYATVIRFTGDRPLHVKFIPETGKTSLEDCRDDAMSLYYQIREFDV